MEDDEDGILSGEEFFTTMYFNQDLAHGYQVNRLDDLNLSDCLKQVGPTLLNCKYYYIIFELCFLGIYEICRKLEKC